MLANKLITNLLAVSAGKTYATFDPAHKSSIITLSNGNLTATQSNTSWQCCFFTVNKTSGLWAIEISQNNLGDGSNYSLVGLDDSRATLSSFIGSDNYGVSMSYAAIGYGIVNGSVTSGYFGVTSTANYKEVVIFDFTNKRVIAKLGTVLKNGAVTAGAGPFYPGVSLYTSSAISFTINTGQTAFTTENETLISNYETANGVTINRGLWV